MHLCLHPHHSPVSCVTDIAVRTPELDCCAGDRAVCHHLSLRRSLASATAAAGSVPRHWRRWSLYRRRTRTDVPPQTSAGSSTATVTAATVSARPAASSFRNAADAAGGRTSSIAGRRVRVPSDDAYSLRIETQSHSPTAIRVVFSLTPLKQQQWSGRVSTIRRAASRAGTAVPCRVSPRLSQWNNRPTFAAAADRDRHCNTINSRLMAF